MSDPIEDLRKRIADIRARIDSPSVPRLLKAALQIVVDFTECIIALQDRITELEREVAALRSQRRD